MPLDPLNVDTSLAEQATDPMSDANPIGLDTPVEPWLDQSLLMPQVSQDQFNEAMADGQMSFNPDAKAPAGNGSIRQNMVSYARQFLGRMYDWGGDGRNGRSFDCSGFVQAVYRHFGVNLPRVSYQQANYGQRISYSQAMAGDIISWDNSQRNNGADHVALYLGNGQIMEFYSSGKPSRIRSLKKNEGFAVTRVKLRGE